MSCWHDWCELAGQKASSFAACHFRGLRPLRGWKAVLEHGFQGCLPAELNTLFEFGRYLVPWTKSKEAGSWYARRHIPWYWERTGAVPSSLEGLTMHDNVKREDSLDIIAFRCKRDQSRLMGITSYPLALAPTSVDKPVNCVRLQRYSRQAKPG
ncbi:hypothetical protein BT63DRAFT_415854 [Microthyrium microscopicum]|uniref:Uncharacterized protein n=1 Tax=Microthyrium microscopicum TaxID=703497 RepID=A0A6A6U4C1_9PEZI|nr:hypothetical protein BT63DRAFT_415854 [Microthyrium microscopicum]